MLRAAAAVDERGKLQVELCSCSCCGDTFYGSLQQIYKRVVSYKRNLWREK